MKQPPAFGLTAAALSWRWIALPPGHAIAQPAADIDGVKAASTAFYAALAVIDSGAAMEKVWAHKPSVTYVGPSSHTFIVGWDAQKEYWAKTNELFLVKNVIFSDRHLHVNRDLAWEMGQETGDMKMKNGGFPKIDFIATDVYEKIDGQWLMVSHHVQPKP